MGILIVAIDGTGGHLYDGDRHIPGRVLIKGYASAITDAAIAAGHTVVERRGAFASSWRKNAASVAMDAPWERVALVVANIGDPRVLYSRRSKAGHELAEAIASKLGQASRGIEPLGPDVDDFRAIDGIWPLPENMAAVLVSPVDAVVMAEEAEAELGAAIGAAVVEYLDGDRHAEDCDMGEDCAGCEPDVPPVKKAKKKKKASPAPPPAPQQD